MNGGADLLLAETYNDFGEAMLALEAMKKYGNGTFLLSMHFYLVFVLFAVMVELWGRDHINWRSERTVLPLLSSCHL